MMPLHTTLSVRDLADGAAHTELLTDDASPSEPLLVVDLDLDRGGDRVTGADLSRAERNARQCDRILVGIAEGAVPSPAHRLAEALDVTLVPEGSDSDAARWGVPVADPGAEAAVLRRKAEAAAQAAVVLARVLRIGKQLSVPDALDVESLAYSTLLTGPGFAHWLAARGPRPGPRPKPGEPVLVRRDGDTLHLTLNRPERRNAYSRELRDALVGALRIAELDDSLAEVVLDGAGPSFCSGGDLDEFGTAPDLAAAHLIRTRAGAARPLHALRDRLTVRIHGHCVGAGIELPAFASRVIADPGTVMRLPELEMGLIPGAGGTVGIPRRIGRWRTLYLVLTGAPLPAERAHRWGLVDQVQRCAPIERGAPTAVADQ
jgi:enoyl-CoA hydratase/carnithine racemase